MLNDMLTENLYGVKIQEKWDMVSGVNIICSGKGFFKGTVGKYA